MKPIFQRTHFPPAPGGDRYEWKGAKTLFRIPENGRYMIAITASAKNGEQNNTGDDDDDDLRISINGYEFGKEEAHAEKISYQGFGTSAAWDGASLKGGTKTVFFILHLDAEEEGGISEGPRRTHVIRFFADGHPQLKSIEVFQLDDQENLFSTNKSPTDTIKTSEKGVPWMTFVFLGMAHPKNFKIIARCKSGKQKGGTDGDNLKIVLNGSILQNPDAFTSDTYKNFYFSGDQMQAESRTLTLKSNDFGRFENSLELWYDESPVLGQLTITFFKKPEKFFEELIQWDAQKIRAYNKNLSIVGPEARSYAIKLFLHSLQDQPPPLVFGTDHPIIIKIKKNKSAYNKVLTLVKQGIRSGKLKNEILIDATTGEINFKGADLFLAIHGIKKIAYEATPKQGKHFDVNISLFDSYDFNHAGLNQLENAKVIENYPIEIKIKETINFKNH